MPIASPEVYAQMLDRAKEGKFAYPAINVSSSQTLNAALAGFAEAGSDGIVQVSWGGANYMSGPTVNDLVAGTVALAEYAHVVAENYPVNIALHTDHCPPQRLDDWLRPLLEIADQRRAEGKPHYFQSHMWDGSAIELEENLVIAEELLEKCSRNDTILEIEIGVVGGEEDGVEAKHDAKLYSTPEDGLLAVKHLGLGENGRYLVAATFGNVHGVYKPGNVKLRPAVLKEIQDVVGEKYDRSRAVRSRLPRRIRFDDRGDPRGIGLRRRQDERRHRLPVRVHPPSRQPHAHPVRGCPEGRWRGRQQEGVRPTCLGQAGRGRDECPRRRGM